MTTTITPTSSDVLAPLESESFLSAQLPADAAPDAVLSLVETESAAAEASVADTDASAAPAAANGGSLTSDEPPPEQPAGEVPPDPILPLREGLLGRIAGSTALPRGIASHLRRALQAAPLIAHDGQLLAPVDALLAAIEGWSPAALRFDPRGLQQGEHPAGDSFFTGDPHQVSDEQAERIARGQLQRSGYLPRGG